MPDPLGWPLVGTLVGACVGSFVATLALRAPAGWAGMWGGRSRCPACDRRLRAAELVPIASWVWLRGRCRSCGAALGIWYPLVEAAGAAVGLVAAAAPLPPSAAVAAALLGWWLLALAAIDLVAWILPDALTLPLLGAGLLLAAAGRLPADPPPTLPAALAGAALGYLALAGLGALHRRLRGREGMGLGDAKLLAAAGAWLGVERLPAVLLAAALLGLLTALLRRRPGEGLRGGTAVPFGPALALAFWAMFLAAASGRPPGG